jgi:hypothetical protein
VATDPSAELLDHLKGFRTELRALRSRHDGAARSFEVNSGLGAVLVDWGLRWAEDQWDIPTSTVHQEAQRLRQSWTESKPYRDLLDEFERFLDRVRTELAPKFRRALPLSPVYKAVNVVTKIRQLDAVLATLEDRTRAWIALGRRPPVGTVRSAKGRPSRPSKSGFWIPRTLSEWVALIAGLGFIISLAVPEIVRGGQSLVSFSIAGVLGIILAFAGAVLLSRRERRGRRT